MRKFVGMNFQVLKKPLPPPQWAIPYVQQVPVPLDIVLADSRNVTEYSYTFQSSVRAVWHHFL
jgi:hypothetical protein